MLSLDEVIDDMHACNNDVFGDIYGWPEFKEHIYGDIVVTKIYILFIFTWINGCILFYLFNFHRLKNRNFAQIVKCLGHYTMVLLM